MFDKPTPGEVYREYVELLSLASAYLIEPVGRPLHIEVKRRLGDAIRRGQDLIRRYEDAGGERLAS